MRFNHIGAPTTGRFEGEIDLPHLQMTVSDHQDDRAKTRLQRAVGEAERAIASGDFEDIEADDLRDWLASLTPETGNPRTLARPCRFP